MFINGWTKETVIAHIETNFKGKAVDAEGNCMYLDEKGRKCAVGLFIPGGHPGQTCSGSVDYLLDQYRDLKNNMPLTLLCMRRMQTIHDGAAPKEILQELISYVRGLE